MISTQLARVIAVGLSLSLSSAAVAMTSEDKEGNWFVNGYVQHQDLSDALDNTGAGMSGGYQYNEKWGTYLGYRKHSAAETLGDAANGVVLGVEYNILPSVFVFSEAVKNSHYDASVAGGAGYRYALDDNWSAIAKAGVDSEYGGLFNVGIRYDFNSKVIKSRYEEPVNRRIPPPEKPKVVTSRFLLDVKFEHDSSVILTEYFPQTGKLVEILKENPSITVLIEGHTSLVGTNEYNKELSERRANAVRSLLVDSHGIESSRIDVVGYGEEKPVLLGETQEAQRVNRRVVAELRYIVKE